jgi:hypothetical protein
LFLVPGLAKERSGAIGLSRLMPSPSIKLDEGLRCTTVDQLSRKLWLRGDGDPIPEPGTNVFYAEVA